MSNLYDEVEEAYIKYTAVLKERESSIKRAEADLKSSDWQSVIDGRAELVEDYRADLLASLTLQGRQKMQKVNDTEVKRKLNASAEYKVHVRELALQENALRKAQKALKALTRMSWGEASRYYIAQIKRLLLRSKLPPAVDEVDEVKVMRRLVALAEERAENQKTATKEIETLILAIVQAEHIEQIVAEARLTSDNAASRLVLDFKEFAEALEEFQESLVEATAAVHAHLQANSDKASSLRAAMSEYTDQITSIDTSMAELEGTVTKRVRGSQNTPEFLQEILGALSTLTPLKSIHDIPKGNRCKTSGVKNSNRPKTDGWEASDLTVPTFKPLLQQQAISIMSSPSYGMNLLVYHTPGTGKSCGISLSIQSIAQYYLNNPPPPSSPKQDNTPAVLVLVQNEKSLPYYLTEILENGCIDQAAMENITIRAGKREKNTHSFSFENTRARITVLNVVVHKMTVALSIPGWNTGVSTTLPATCSRWEIPKYGAVIVDEAHNLFNSTQMGCVGLNHTKKYLMQLVARGDIQTMFNTGTPVLDSDRFDDLARMLDLLRRPEKGQYIGSEDLVNRPEHLNPAIVNKWFEKEEKGYKWKSGALDLFKRSIAGYVSFMDLENDVGVYPRFSVVLNNKELPGQVTCKWSPSTGSVTGSVTEVHSGGGGKSVMIMTVPSDPYLLKKESNPKGYKSANGKVGVHFNTFTEMRGRVPPKWIALQHMLQANNTKKHFIFMAKSNALILRKFCNWLKMKEFKGGDVIEQGKAERYLIVESAGTKEGEDALKMFNHPDNTKGEYIRFILGPIAVKEGMTLCSTHFVHLVEPPPTATVFDQAVRRAARFCSMKWIDDVREWAITVVVYVAEGSLREAAFLSASLAVDASPVTLAYDAIKSAAVDCYLYSPLTGVVCTGKGTGANAQALQKYCQNPQTGKLTAYTIVDGAEKMTTVKCIAEDCIPGALLAYDVWDEIMMQLLQTKYTSAPLTQKGMLKLFSQHAGKFSYGMWEDQLMTPVLTFSRTVRPEVLMTWIEGNPKQIGDSVLYLLENKRKNAVSAQVAKLSSIASLHVKKFDLQVKQRQDLVVRLQDVERSLRVENDRNKTESVMRLSASLLLKAKLDVLKSKRAITPSRSRSVPPRSKRSTPRSTPRSKRSKPRTAPLTPRSTRSTEH